MALIIFLVTYIYLAGYRLPFLKLDRPGAALVGALAMVLFKVVPAHEVMGHSPDPSHRAIDYDTLLLLFGMMLLAAYLQEAAFFRTVGYHAVRLSRTPRTLLVALCAVSAALSAFVVNDTVCLMLTPLVL